MNLRRPAPTADDLALPSTARIYDYLLGGHENYKVDRQAAKDMVATVPDSPTAVRSNRAFLYRAVRFLAGEAGVTQFLDIGSGLPTQLNVHQVAHGVSPRAHVVYVDYDPLVNAFGNALMSTTDTVSFARRDLRYPGEILADQQVRELIDFDRPVAVLLIAMLQFIDESEDPHGIVGQLIEALPSGSYIAISHVLDDPRTRAIADIQERANTHPWTPRPAGRIRHFFDGLELVEPGLTVACRWRPDPDTPMLERPADLPILLNPDGTEQDVDWLLAGIGRKP
ncbi:SAM-dependent methyltransferase [Actinospica durhamensis]|uniref:SAM-dependent methyltransferase n=1 Tax=Actinospica durhamensis TaxID=1508375 RepID=A0A941IR94_9ACTN|nr:SAM-dependent methyltransferase [Actinospica durhamensis]MBR7838560.1 SAM-dependent methyltransferase [Actinospica durhamensis]